MIAVRPAVVAPSLLVAFIRVVRANFQCIGAHAFAENNQRFLAKFVVLRARRAITFALVEALVGMVDRDKVFDDANETIGHWHGLNEVKTKLAVRLRLEW